MSAALGAALKGFAADARCHVCKGGGVFGG